jgi:hypothetical protein
LSRGLGDVYKRQTKPRVDRERSISSMLAMMAGSPP